MAGALVGGAFLSATLQVLFDRIASRPVLNFFKGQTLSDQLLKELKTKMITINKVVDDADDRQHTDPDVKQWLAELKHAVYEAEDLLDEVASEFQRLEMEAESQTPPGKVQDSASSHNAGKNEKLKEILGELKYLVEQKTALGLIDGTGGKPSYQRTPTTSIADESVIYGRDADKDAIIKWVLSDELNNNPDVLPIVGLGGLGKTTLAQHVFNDEDRVAGCFDEKAWVCVSQEFNVSRVTKDIFEGFTGEPPNTNNLDQLQSQLQNKLRRKIFFLVLDDFWNADYDEWQNLQKPLMFGKKGSKILVTSRNLHVADCVKTSPTHQLEKLSQDDCWLLFKRHAFMGTDVSTAHSALEPIGRQIVEKCDGLPLAAKLLGGALRSERNPEEWKKILESDMLDVHNNNILPILKLSYRLLPFHLKRCFAYCAVFPQDYKFQKEPLIRLWMAEGLLNQPKVKMDIEKVGADCFDDLVSRSFFQQSREKCFLMHDLINDLAKSIAGEFCFRYGVDRPGEITKRIRHLWLGREQVDERIFPIQHLRSIFRDRWLKVEEDENWLPTFTRLRVLSLRCNKLPDSIGNLMHLRYLDLSGSLFKRLPDSVASLYNLETLLLLHCPRLVELPATIFKLIYLSQLDIRGTRLIKMPPHMGKLKKLGELAYYIVGKESDCSIKELGPLQRLRGELRIEKLRNVSQVKESEEANLKSKGKLKKLELIWNDEGSEDSLHERNVLEQLRPHTNIEQVKISGYAGTRFPDWVGDSSFSNMVELELLNCGYCGVLPPLGQLGSLERLSIIGFDGITVVEPEFYGNSNKPPFGSLESLKFKGMPQWQEWIPYSNADEGDRATAAFPLLQVLQIEDCPKLRKTLPVELPSLKTLEIWGCKSLESFPLDLAPALEKLKITLCGNLEYLSAATTAEFEHLETVKIEHCPNLREIQLTRLSCLKTLKIWDCGSLENFSLDLALALEYLKITGCENLEFFSAAATVEFEHLKTVEIGKCLNLREIQLTHLPCLKTLRIWDCSLLESFPLDLAPTLEYLKISFCGNLEFLSAAATAEFEHLKTIEIGGCRNLREIQLTHLPCLKILRIWNCGSLESFPLDLAPALEYLKITGCGNLKFLSAVATAEFKHLKSLEINGLKEIQLTHLPSLKQLKIGTCSSLESIPLDLFPALEDLQISHCTKLEFLPAAAAADFEYLKSLEIKDCPNLKEIQPTHLPSLINLRISGCDQLVSLPRAPAPQKLIIVANSPLELPRKTRDPLLNFPRTVEVRCRNSSNWPLEMVEQLMAADSIPLELEELVVGGWDSVTSFPLDLFPMSKSLVIYDCAKLESLSAASQAQPLQRCISLELRGCPNLKRLPECMLASLFLSLNELHIDNCPESIVVDLLRISPNLSRLYLRRCCEEVESFTPENTPLPSTLTYFEIDEFPNLTSFHNKVLRSLTCLQQLRIENCPKLQSLPEVWLPSTLTILTISRLENLESLDHWGLHRLTSLTGLHIFQCPKLQSISHEGPPSSLQHVRIYRCPLLKLDKDSPWWPYLY